MASWPRFSTAPWRWRCTVFTTAPFWLALAGWRLSYYMYMVNPALPAAIKARCSRSVHLLENKYYLDWINENILARGAVPWHRPLEGRRSGHHRRWVVNGSWKLVGAGFLAWCAGCRRALSVHYALVMILGVFALMTWFVWLNK
jgi:NADH-quinone oxidoreductase subunit L